MTLGVDIGTGSVRIYDTETSRHNERDISTTTRGKHITQSSQEIYGSIMEMWEELRNGGKTKEEHANGANEQMRGSDQVHDTSYREAPGQDISCEQSIAIAATCSQVVLLVQTVNGIDYFIPFDCTTGDKGDQDIILWMDVRSEEECAEITRSFVNHGEIHRLGGALVPELGITKMRWVSKHWRDLYMFELYDWISYCFLAGGFEDLGDVRGVRKISGPLTYDETCAYDGSVKGWLNALLKDCGIDVSVGGCTASTGIGEVAGKAENGVTIYSGCIDCYGGWLDSKRNREIIEESKRKDEEGNLNANNKSIFNIPKSHERFHIQVSMVAGTSTCFIFEGPGGYLSGWWGPFGSTSSLYSAGQPATGRLYERLFTKYHKLLENVERPFDMLNHEVDRVESQNGKCIYDLIRGYAYYGDVFGNRSPYMDFSMGEVLIDGHETSDYVGKLGYDIAGLIIEYVLTMEFLAFQTKQILLTVPGLCGIAMTGSQSQNPRFVALVHEVVGVPISVEYSDKFSVARGIGSVGEPKTGSIREQASWEHEAITYPHDLLKLRYDNYLTLAEGQRRKDKEEKEEKN